MTPLARQIADAFDRRMVHESGADREFCGSISVTCNFHKGKPSGKIQVAVHATSSLKEQAA